MKALSIKQPWAWLICAGYKDIENRNWKTDFRGRIYVHASKDEMGCLITSGETYGNLIPFPTERLPKGAIIGEVDIVDCVFKSKSPWFIGRYGFVLANPVLYGKPIPCKGSLKFFDVPMEVINGKAG